MPCTLFRNEGMGLCEAVADQHTPTVFERERYCLRSGHGCPVLGAFRGRGGIQLNVLDYLDTWSGAWPPTAGSAG